MQIKKELQAEFQTSRLSQISNNLTSDVLVHNILQNLFKVGLLVAVLHLCFMLYQVVFILDLF